MTPSAHATATHASAASSEKVGFGDVQREEGGGERTSFSDTTLSPERQAFLFKHACRLHTDAMIHWYLMANAHGRWDGHQKALQHRELCQFYRALHLGCSLDAVNTLCPVFKALHASTQTLTDALDETIGFPLESAPDYATLVPLFFERFHELAMKALQPFCAETQTPSLPARSPSP